jgi:transposase
VLPSKGAPYPQEFREEAVRYWLASGQSLKTVATDLGITTECLRAWRRQMESPEDQAPANRDSTSAQDSSPSATAKELALAREVCELRRELEAMTRQRDILKKAISIFSEDKSINGGLK